MLIVFHCYLHLFQSLQNFAIQTAYLLVPEPRAALDHVTPLYTALGDTVKKAVEFVAELITSNKYSNSAQNSVKATDIRTNGIVK